MTSRSSNSASHVYHQPHRPVERTATNNAAGGMIYKQRIVDQNQIRREGVTDVSHNNKSSELHPAKFSNNLTPRLSYLGSDLSNEKDHYANNFASNESANLNGIGASRRILGARKAILTGKVGSLELRNADNNSPDILSGAEELEGSVDIDTVPILQDTQYPSG